MNGEVFMRNIRQQGRRSTSSSLSSNESGSRGGGKIKTSFRTRNFAIFRRCSDGDRGGNSNRSKEFLLRGNRQSLPRIRTLQATSASNRHSNKNEEWDCSNITAHKSNDVLWHLERNQSKAAFGGALSSSQALPTARSSQCITPSNQKQKSPGTSNNSLNVQPKSAIKGIGEGRRMKKVNVTFAPEIELLLQEPRPLECAKVQWYTRLHHVRFLNDAIIRADLTNRTMKYAAINEKSYNSSTGLTSPQVLKEYLTSPEEIIGLERMLTVQKTARVRLKRHHMNAFMREQLRQKREGYDIYSLASKLTSTSAIAAHMAHERAMYITKI